MRLLCGELPYQGEIHASVSFERFPYPVSDPQQLVGEVLTHMVPEAEEWEIRRECSLLHLSDGIFDPAVFHFKQWGTDQSATGGVICPGKCLFAD